MDFLNKKVLVVGVGKSGISAARWLCSAGATVRASDIRSEEELDREDLGQINKLGIDMETGGHRIETFLDEDMIIVSPGVPLGIEPLKAAKKKNITIMGEMELASRLIKTPMVAITGTNGKSTATAFIGEMIRNAGFRTFVGGNIGTPLMDYAAGKKNADYAVVEVSSFQLDTSVSFCPAVSLLLNISPDHLDRYSHYDDYVRSKLSIFQNQDVGQSAILNDDDEILASFNPSGGVSILRYGKGKKENRQAYMDGNRIIASLPGKRTRIFDMKNFRLPGKHNLENVMGCILAGLSLDLEPNKIQETIDGFQGLPHRIEFVRRLRGVDFYNDSKATNIDAAIKAILSFDRPIVLIAGGRHKGTDYKPLVRAGKGRVKKGIFIGEAKYLLAGSFRGHIPFEQEDDMKAAVSLAFSSAVANDVVLLAPACSSFDMYSGYAERGNFFKAVAWGLNNGR